MKHSLPAFTPSLAPFEVLDRLFVVRHQLLGDIVDRVRAAASSPSRNHTLVVGPRGAGKTHLVSLAYYRVQQLRHAGEITVQVAWLPEDPWGTTSYRRLLDSLLQHVEPGLEGGHLPDSVESAEGLLLRRAQEIGPLVCFIENLDQVLASIGTQGQQRLRHLAQERALLFVATTTSLSRALSDQAAPFYSFFTTTRLDPFTVEQAATMLQQIAEHQGDAHAATYLRTDEALGRLRAVAHLAGGQPRIWALLARALTVGGLEELVSLLLTQFDDLTPYYQEQLGRLSPHQRDIVVTLAELDHPASVKELADVAGIDQRSVGKTIVELRDKGWVTETDSRLVALLDRRRTYYELAEPLARLAFQLKAARGTPVRLIVEFLKSWFDPEQLHDGDLADALTSDYVHEALIGYESDPILAVSRRLRSLPASRAPVIDLLGELDDACAALGAGDPEPLLRMPGALRAAVEARLPDRLADPDLGSELFFLRFQLHVEALEETPDLQSAVIARWEERARTLESDGDTRPYALALVVAWNGRMGAFSVAEAVLEEVDRLAGKDGAAAFFAREQLASALGRLGKFREAIVIDESVAATQSASDGYNLARTYARLAGWYRQAGRVQEAVQAYEVSVRAAEAASAEEKLPILSLRKRLADALEAAGRTTEAIELLSQIVAECEDILTPEHPTTVYARLSLAASYSSAGRDDEATAIAEQMLRDPVVNQDRDARIGLYLTLSRSYAGAGRNEDALRMAQMALEESSMDHGPGDPAFLVAQVNVAFLLSRQGRVDEAIAIGEKAARSWAQVRGDEHPATLKALGNLATLYGAAGRTDDALALARHVLMSFDSSLGQDHPAVITTRANLAVACMEAGLIDEAMSLGESATEAAVRVFGSLHPETLTAKANLVAVYRAGSRASEALAIAEDVLRGRRERFGEAHPKTLEAELLIAEVREELTA